MTRSRANLLLLLAGATWGAGFVAQATAMRDIGPFLFIALRFLVASMVVAPFAWRERAVLGAADRRAVDTPTLARFALIGLVLFAGMATQQVGLLSTSVTNSGFLTGLYVVFTPVLAVVLFRERLSAVVWPACVLALVGIWLLAGGRASGNAGDLPANLAGSFVPGDLLTVGSAVFWALQVVLIARFAQASGRPLALSFVQFACTALLAAAVALVREPIDWQAIVRALPSVLYAGVFASGFAFTLQAVAQRHTTAAQAAIFLSSEAPFAALFAFVLLGERIGLIGLGGCALILAAMLLVELWSAWLARRAVASVKPTGSAA